MLMMAREDYEVSKLSAAMGCRLDMKGCFNIFDKSAVQLQRNRIVISIASNAPPEVIHRLVQEAKGRAVCFQAIVSKNKVALERHDESVSEASITASG